MKDEIILKINVACLGRKLDKLTMIFTDCNTGGFLKNLNVGKAFISNSGYQ